MMSPTLRRSRNEHLMALIREAIGVDVASHVWLDDNGGDVFVEGSIPSIALERDVLATVRRASPAAHAITHLVLRP